MKQKHKVSLQISERATEEFSFPSWQDCTWRRLTCGQTECPFCSRMIKQRKRHIEQGEDPDSIDTVLKDVEESFAEIHTALAEQARALGVDTTHINETARSIPEPPGAKTFPLYLQVLGWRQDVQEITKKSYHVEAPWIFTEAGRDLNWYTNLLPVKVARAFSSRWRKENEPGGLGADYEYTQYVLRECTGILVQALGTIRSFDFSAPLDFEQLEKDFLAMKAEIESI